jgi:hypothetical protein
VDHLRRGGGADTVLNKCGEPRTSVRATLESELMENRPSVRYITPKLEKADYLHDYTVRVKFADGMEGDIDLRDELWGEVFEPLKNPEVFQAFRLDRELNTIVWPTGADLAPEFLYDQATDEGL